MASIKLYQNITPNRGIFYFKNPASLMQDVLLSHTYKVYTETTARLVNNVLVVVDSTIIDPDSVTYVAEERTAYFMRYYFVKNVQDMGSYKFVFELEIDYFATYAYKASYDEFFIERSNKYITDAANGSVKLDNIENAIDYDIEGDGDRDYKNYTPIYGNALLENVYLIFAVDVQTYKQKTLFDGTITTSDRFLYAVRPYDMINLIDPQTQQPISKLLFPLAYIEEAIKVFASLYAVHSGNDDYDANVAGIWLVPADLIGFTDTDNLLNFKFVYESTVNFAPNHIISGLKSARVSMTSKAFEVEQKLGCVAFFGTKSAMLELPRIMKRPAYSDVDGIITVCAEMFTKKDAIQIIVRCGDNQLDITESFSVGIPNSQGALKPEERIARGVQTLGALAGAATQMAAGNYVSGALNAVTAVLPRDKSPNAAYKSNGDGLTSWTDTSEPQNHALIEYPFGITYYLSSKGRTELQRITNYGAIINDYLFANQVSPNRIRSIIQNEQPIFGSDQTTYIKAKCIVVGVPTDAARYIEGLFARGIRFWNQ